MTPGYQERLLQLAAELREAAETLLLNSNVANDHALLARIEHLCGYIESLDSGIHGHNGAEKS